MTGRSVSAVSAYTAHREWASRPPDERYASVHALFEAARARRQQLEERTIETGEFRTEAVDDDLAVRESSGRTATLTHWSFVQLATIVAAGAGADFQDHVALVHRVLRNKREPELPLERRAFLLELRLLGGGHRAHFGIGRRVGDERIEARDLGGDGAIVLHRLDDGSELGELARELDVGFGRHRARQLAFDRLVAGDERIEFWLRNHGCADSRTTTLVGLGAGRSARRVRGHYAADGTRD